MWPMCLVLGAGQCDDNMIENVCCMIKGTVCSKDEMCAHHDGGGADDDDDDDDGDDDDAAAGDGVSVLDPGDYDEHDDNENDEYCENDDGNEDEEKTWRGSGGTRLK